MARTDAHAEATLQLTRTFAAPRAEVFRAWTEPAALTRWFGPPGYATRSAEVDLRVGGRYRFAMRELPDGGLFYLSGTYGEVRPPEKLIYTWNWEGQPELGETLVTVTFRDLGRSTEVVVTHERFPAAEVRDKHREGWSGSLDRLAGTFQG